MLGLTRRPHIAPPAPSPRTPEMSGGDQQTAALPWAAVELQGEKAEPDWPGKLGLSLGSRVEVRKQPRAVRKPHLDSAAACLPLPPPAAAAQRSSAPARPLQVQWSIHKEQEGGEEISLTKVGTVRPGSGCVCNGRAPPCG